MKPISDRDVKFLLKDAKSVRPTPINLVFRYDNARFKIATGQSVEPDQWDADRQRAHTNQKGRAAREPFETINGHLDRLRSAVKKVVTALQLAGIPLGNNSIKHYLDEELGRAPRGRGPATTTEPVESFTAYIDRFVRESKAGQRLNARNVHYADYTLAGYMKLKRVLERYRLETGSEVPQVYWGEVIMNRYPNSRPPVAAT